MGTEGADVIVTNGETRVDALGGDDLVCATIEDGVGYNPVFAILGAGADTFTASDGGSHTIFAGTADGTDTEADVIDLAFGEVSWSGIQTAPGAVSVATGGILGVRSADGDVTMDASGTVTGVDTKLTWTGQFDRLVFTTSAERGRITFRRTSGTEHVKGDGGRNQLLLGLGSHDRVRADLSRSRVTATKAGAKDSIRVRGFDDLIVTAKRADVIGTNRANRVGVIACRTTIEGTKGRDDLYADSQYRGLGTWTTPRCDDDKATIWGGPGNDTITGSLGSDRLIGGSGKDTAKGRSGGFDVCLGEKLRECEKRIWPHVTRASWVPRRGSAHQPPLISVSAPTSATTARTGSGGRDRAPISARVCSSAPRPPA